MTRQPVRPERPEPIKLNHQFGERADLGGVGLIRFGVDIGAITSCDREHAVRAARRHAQLTVLDVASVVPQPYGGWIVELQVKP